MNLPRTILRPAGIELPLDRNEVMRYLGYKPGLTQLDARHEELVDRGTALAVGAVQPAVSLTYCSIAIEGETVRTQVPGLCWESRSLARLLKGAVGVSLVAATLGAAVTDLVDRLFQAEEYALATVVDAAGSALVHGLSRYCRTHVASGEPDLTFTPLYGPGYGDWNIYDQIPFTALAGGPEIGLVSTDSCYLEPQKSLVGIIGWIPASTGRRAVTSGCALCSMKDCAYRVKPMRETNVGR